MRYIFILFASVIFSNAYSQDVSGLDKYTIDTIHLEAVSIKKVLVYHYNNVTFQVDYTRCKEILSGFRKRFHKYKGYEKERQVFDSLHFSLKKRFRKYDTAYIDQDIFNSLGIYPLDLFLAEQIEAKNCLIMDEDGNRHNSIVRVKGSYHRGPLHAWGGRRYYLPGRNEFFISKTDWVS